tara:strand:- start:1084 stop:1326 length:243 start_codon:yes stop_codon:yes gene_type:complete
MEDLKDYDHDELDDSLKACGLSKGLADNLEGMSDVIMSASRSKNLISQLTEFCENNFSKRELAFVLSKLTLDDIIEKIKK